MPQRTLRKPSWVTLSSGDALAELGVGASGDLFMEGIDVENIFYQYEVLERARAYFGVPAIEAR